MRLKCRLVVLFIAMFMLTGCGSHLPPNATPQLKVAAYTGDVVATVNQVAMVTATLPIADDTKAPIIIAANRIQRLGPRVASALDAYDAADAANKKAAADAVTAAVNDISAILDSLHLPADSRVSQVAQLLVKLAGIIGQIRGVLTINAGLVPATT